MEQKKVWIYCRTAHPDDVALCGQGDVLKAYAGTHQMTIAGVTAECGSGLDMNRKGLSEVYDAAKRGAMDFVLVKNMNRLGRVILDVSDYVDQLTDYGVQVIYLDGQMADDHLTKTLRALVKAYNACQVRT